MKRLSAVFFMVTLTTALCATSTKKDHDFINNYSVNNSLAAILDAHSQELDSKIASIHSKATQKHGVWQFDWLPHYYVKYNLARIRGMELMKRSIKRHNLWYLEVPNKQIYHIAGRPKTLTSRNYAIVIKEVPTDKEQSAKPLTLTHVQQLITLMKDTGYISMIAGNYIRTAKGNLSIIDTEATYDHSKLHIGYLRMLGPWHNLNTDYTQEALELILQELATSLKKLKHAARQPTLKKALGFLHSQPNPSWDYEGYFIKLMNDR